MAWVEASGASSRMTCGGAVKGHYLIGTAMAGLIERVTGLCSGDWHDTISGLRVCEMFLGGAAYGLVAR